MTRFTDEQATRIMDEIQKARDEGLSLKQACFKTRHGLATFYRIKKSGFKPKPRDPQVIIHEPSAVTTYVKKPKAQMNGKCFVMITDAHTAAQMIRDFI